LLPTCQYRDAAPVPSTSASRRMQGFFLAFALWLQAGEHFSPLKAGLTAVAFSVGSFIGAPVAVPLAQRYGRSILAIGGALMVAGIAATWSPGQLEKTYGPP
jgi:MFS family permease